MRKLFFNYQLTLRLLVLSVGFLPTLALADSGNFQLVSVLEGLINLLDSQIARIIFVLSIIGIGYGWLYLGRIPKDKAIGAIVGIGIVFSATYIAQQLGIGN